MNQVTEVDGKPARYGKDELITMVKIWQANDYNPLNYIECIKFTSPRFDGNRYAFGIQDFGTEGLVFADDRLYKTRAAAIAVIGMALDAAETSQ